MTGQKVRTIVRHKFRRYVLDQEWLAHKDDNEPHATEKTTNHCTMTSANRNRTYSD